MARGLIRKAGFLLGVLLLPCAALQSQPATPAQLIESGKILVGGESTPYRIRRLPISSFPDLPSDVADLLNRRGCLIPQTYEAHHPENVVHASLERAGSSDWAILCSAQGTVSLLVYFASAPSQLLVLASTRETQRLQAHDLTGVLGFNWGIDPASPQHIHEDQIGMEHRPPLLDHDALADSVIDRHTVYHFYLRDSWTVIDVPN